MRGHITSGAGIGVVAPSATDPICFLDDQVIDDAKPVEFPRHGNTAEACTDDENIDHRV